MSADEAATAMKLDARMPGGPIETRWERAKFEMKLVKPANKRRFTVIVVGSGLAGASAGALSGVIVGAWGYPVLTLLAAAAASGLIAAVALSRR